MKQLPMFFVFFLMIILFSSVSSAQNVYELRQYTDQDWNSLNTYERLKALNTSNNHSVNQTLAGDMDKGIAGIFFNINPRNFHA